MVDFDKIIEKIESKKKDSIAFQKKYKSRKMKDLEKYYEGAEWAFIYTLSLLEED
tara:strand:- start:56 stop:220 length:165 start_codon:yes stop_codon:yes gene_type:complete